MARVSVESVGVDTFGPTLAPTTPGPTTPGPTPGPTLSPTPRPTPKPTHAPTSITCTDGTINGDETDVDCGGSCPTCGVGEACATAADCESAECAGGE